VRHVTVELPDGSTIRASEADTRRERMRGLLGSSPDRALLLRGTRSIHTFGMRYPIDAMLLDADLRVVEVVHLEPRRLLRPRRDVRHVLEVPAPAPAIRAGDAIRIA
jgi:uncharacterized membrane protein (UPF0127 family)